jgi:RNA-directed DNA polymerase
VIILLWSRRWLTAPLQKQDDTLVARDRGSPHGSAISPPLANLFMHHACDAWTAREHPGVRFERYCDDVVVHRETEQQAERVGGVVRTGWLPAWGRACEP